MEMVCHLLIMIERLEQMTKELQDSTVCFHEAGKVFDVPTVRDWIAQVK